MKPIHPGYQIREAKEGDTDLLSATRWNELIVPLNAMLNGKAILGAAPKFEITGKNATWTMPTPSASATATTAAGFHPLKIYHPTSSSAGGHIGNTFRLRAGYCHIPEIFPSSSTQREITIDSTYTLEPVNESDGIFDSNTDDEGDDTYDIVLDNWDNGGGGHYSFCGFWLAIYQIYTSPGVIAITLESGFNTIPPAVTKYYAVNDGSEITNYIPLAVAFPTGFNGDDITGAEIHQLQYGSYTMAMTEGPSRHVGEYLSNRVYFPGDIVFWSSTGGEYINRNFKAIINYAPNTNEWFALA